MLQARLSDGSDATPVGTFFSEDLPPDTATLACSQTDDTLGHSTRNVKDGITVSWIPPADSVGDIVF